MGGPAPLRRRHGLVAAPSTRSRADAGGVPAHLGRRLRRGRGCDDAAVSYPETVVGALARYERWDPARRTDAFTELCADPEVMRFLGGPMRRMVAAEVSERIADHWATFGFGLWAVVEAAGGRVAGFTGACLAAWHPQFAEAVEVGWRLARWSWGRGFATEGARLALEPAFGELRVAELLAFVHPDNHRSRAVVERLGMPRTGATVDPRLRHRLDIFTLPAPAPHARPVAP